MPKSPEAPGFASNSWEAKESEPPQKHEVAIERDVGTAVAERADYLEGVWDVDDYEDGQNQEQMLEDWKNELPEHKEFVEQFPFSKDIAEIIDDANMWDRKDDIHKMQDLCKSVLERYGSADGSEGWNELPEKNKRYVRMAEMTFLTMDARKLERDIDSGNINPKSAAGLIGKLQRYGESNDVPESFKKDVIDRALTKFTKSQVPEQAKRRLTPEQQKQLEKAMKDKMKRASQEEQPAARSDSSRVESADAGPETAVDDDAIYMEFNPETGAYEPVGEEYATPEASPGEPKRLTYNPDVSSPDTSAGTPSVGPEAPSSTPGGGSIGGGEGGGAVGGAGGGGAAGGGGGGGAAGGVGGGGGGGAGG